MLDPSVAGDLAAIRALHPGDPVFTSADDADATWLVGVHQRLGPDPVLHLRPGQQDRPLPVRSPAGAVPLPAGLDGAVLVHRPGRPDRHGYVTFPPEGGRAGRRPCSTCTAARGPGTTGASTPRPSGWPTGATSACRSTTAARPATARRSSTPATASGAAGCTMTWSTRSAFITGQGWADPARVAIYGGSYGGYAALVGASLHAGPVPLRGGHRRPVQPQDADRDHPAVLGAAIAQFHRRVGNPETDAEFLWSRSPLSRAADIRIPLLIAQGANDPRVKQAESEQIVAALARPGSSTSTCCSPTRATASPSPRTG